MDSVDYFKVEEESYPLIFWIIYSEYDNRTRQTGRVIHDLYSPNTFYTHLGERASVIFLPCTVNILTVCSAFSHWLGHTMADACAYI